MHAAVIPRLQKFARAAPDRLAFTCFREGSDVPTKLTFGQVEARAASIAAELSRRAPAGSKALLLYPPGPEFIEAFFGVLWAGLVAVPVPPPSLTRPGRTTPRLLSIARDAGAALMLTTQGVADAAGSLLQSDPELSQMSLIATDRIAGPGMAPRAPVDALAMLQYTSGSTFTPKGVMLSHQNLEANLSFLDDGFQTGPDDVLVTWVPHFHDMGLLYGVLEPVFVGQQTILLPPIDVMKRPRLWLETISNFGGTLSMAPNFMYELCLRKIPPAEREGLDLSRWRMALNAAEPVRWETMVAFAEGFAPVGFSWQSFSPGYGLSENTCKVCTTPLRAGPTSVLLDAAALERHRVEVVEKEGPKTRRVVASGAIAAGCEVTIVEPTSGRRCAPDAVGEVWLRGPSVGSGYWANAEATSETFGATIAGEDQGGYLRTGDLGFIRDGQIFITGRYKDLVIIRGQNHYPQDLEFSAQSSHVSIRPGCCAAFSVERNGEEQLIMVVEVERRSGKDRRTEQLPPPGGLALRSGVERRVDVALPEHQPASREFSPELVRRAVVEAVTRGHDIRAHEVVLIKPGAIPKTSSGKIQRRACRAAYLKGELELIEP